MIDLQNIDTVLVEASFRGIPFFMPNTSMEVGRRVQRVFFPGRDDTAFQDLGAFDGPIKVAGLVHGDDYVDQSLQLRDAFRTAGSGLLVHPWLGQMLVVLTEKVTIKYDFQEQRIARFEAVFAPYDPPAPAPADTLGLVADACETVQAQASSLLNAILGTVALTLAVVGTVEDFCLQAAAVWTNVVAVDATMAAAAAGTIVALQGVGGLIADATYAGAIAALLGAPSAAIALTSQTLLPSAIGPGDLAPSSMPLDAAITTTALLAADSQFLALAAIQPSQNATVSMLALAAAAIAVADAADAGTDLVFASQQDALAWLVQIMGAIDATATLATTLAPAQPIAAGMVWNALQALRGAVAADINAQVGRLPVVQTLTLLSSVPVWLIAQGLSGDNPGAVLATYTDLVARNAVANPALAAPGTIEALVA